jgi:probable F420-dependent oxidoreductase
VTQRLEFATGILVLPSRQTVLVAKQAAGIDVLSGGRLRLGVAVGWNPLEYQAMDVDIHTRGRRIEEQIRVLRALWTQPLVTFKGEFHTIDDLGINPMPIQRPIPIWIGGIAAPILQRAARLADGWLPPTLPLERAEKLVTRLHTYLEEAGRELKGFGISARMKLSQASDWQKHLERWQSWGATHFELNTMGADLETPQAHIDALRRFKAVLQG